jgi:Htaa
MEVLKMPTPNFALPGRIALAAALSLPLASSAAMVVDASPAAARAHVAAKKKSKGVAVKLKSGTLAIVFTPSSWSRISGGSPTVGTTTTAIAPATGTATGGFSFPISGGTLNSVSGRGSVSSKGGFTIASHLSIAGFFESSSSASASNPSASLGSSATLILTSSNFTPPNVPLFKLATTHVKAIGSKHAVTLNKIPASLTPAGLQFFGSSFKAGETVATVSIAGKA